MNSKQNLCFIAFQLMICSSIRISNSYYISESEQVVDEIQINSFSDNNKHLENNNDWNSENKSLNEYKNISTVFLKQNKRSIPTAKVKSCYFCSKETELFTHIEDQYNQRLEYIKLQILSKLGLSEAPKLFQKNTETYNYLQLLEASSLTLSSTLTLETVIKSEPKESDKVFIFPTVKRLNIPQFNISIAKNTFDAESIIKITLFVKLKSSQIANNFDKELVVISTAVPVNGILTRFQDISNMRVLGIIDPENDNLVDRQSTYDWLQYDLTKILKPEVTKTNKLVSFDSESFDMKDSFITIEQHNTNLIRSKRSVDCTGNLTSCCRESFYVNFTTIGWDNWILQPPGYNANYCKGKCDISNARYHHTTVMGKYPAINLCCSPREMSHISMIYLDENGGVFQKNLANMVVESCDCA